MKLIVCSIHDIPRWANTGITHVLSLIDANFTDLIHREGVFLPEVVNTAYHLFETYQEKPNRLELKFDDVSADSPAISLAGYVAPTEYDVQRILTFGATIPTDPEPTLLVHCHAGISRSTAAAILILMQRHPEKDISEVFDMVSKVRPVAFPNRLILSLGAELLKRSWEMGDACRERFGK